ncbi:hypothetical protein EDB19DRAFT_1917117 [Suillus lakei]|nr:hypothetical protein EDB19DRAFT_1917117 [Suillus lakei]
MVYYAYIKHIRDDWSARFVIVFASRAVADEWWRVVSTSPRFSDSVRRVTPQFFTHDQANITESIQQDQVAARFIGKMFFTLLGDKDGRQLSIIPSFDFTDHVSGNCFFIRSKSSPNEYWFVPHTTLHTAGTAPITASCLSSPNNNPNFEPQSVYVSRTERTRFRVQLTGRDTAGTIMIGSDEISITLPSVNLPINVDENGQVVVSQTPQSGLRFGDLLDGFCAGPTLYDKDGKSLDLKELIKTAVADGEEWELV